ncbi:unnamed protein product, partial [Sphagnum jensenii]
VGSVSRPDITDGSAEASISRSNAPQMPATAAAQPAGTHSHPDSVIRIGLILPFDAQGSLDLLTAAMTDDGLPKPSDNGLKEPAHVALDFYEGLRYALDKDSSGRRIAIYVFDSQNSDSVVQELLKNDSLRACDIIIGPTAYNQARTVAAFCKTNRIINIQPFVSSKSFSTDNPYLVRFVPTIDAHLQKEYEMVLDSFSDANIVIYTTKRERDMYAARLFDTLFSSYNSINPAKLKYAFFNSSDSTLPAPRRSLSYYLRPGQRNVVMMACYEDPLINSQLRTLRENTVVFGMPTWIEAEQIRVDYLDRAQPYFTDFYYVDTARTPVADFVRGYNDVYNQSPSRFAYLGYDAMRYLSVIFAKYGKAFTQGFDNESYDGLAYSFHISPVITAPAGSDTPAISYYTNTAMHLFQVSDYKVWMIR